ncbi:TAXI family TRAP transporter solute-binding subunit [Roseiarcaceae bacterium H3SJ34-1]|uniref:TAXI family TRAP transporter solute-binding subunit n=1 Tax=Terripilifer ovatus TaxID=3032367 RepID=UPI003AB94C09|nr:TAXI family TRAP transporter solute-binding subunit [Roseiarcaceae bacterium H3SJ34-1]
MAGIRGRAGRTLRLVGVLFGMLVIAAGGTLAASYWLYKPRVLVFAAGPEGSAYYRFAQKLAETVAANSRSIRISVQATETPLAAITRLGKLDADIAIGRTDQKFPTTARTVAVLEHDVVVLVAPKASKITSLASLRGRKVAVTGPDGQNEAFAKRLFEAMQIPHSAYSLQTVPADMRFDRLIAQPGAQAIAPAGPQPAYHAVLAIGPRSQFDTRSRVDQPDRRPALNLEVQGLEDAKAIERRVPGVYAETVEAGTLTSSPKWPPEDIETIALYHELLVNRMPSAVATELTRMVFENKEELGLDREFATRIEPPETDKGEYVIAHQGAVDYFNGDVKGFLDRYSDFIYIGTSILGVVGSLVYGLYSWTTKTDPVKSSLLARDLLIIAEKVDGIDTLDALDKTEDELERALKDVLVGLQENRFSAEGLDVLRLAYDHSHKAIAARRRVLIRNDREAARKLALQAAAEQADNVLPLQPRQ